MKTIDMLRSHPRRRAEQIEEIAACIAACLECADACAICADACLGEEKVTMLKRCIRTDLDCAEVCRTTASLLARSSTGNVEILISQLHACAVACRICAAECEQHAEMHRHCRICASACRTCEMVCHQTITLLQSGGTAEPDH